MQDWLLAGVESIESGLPGRVVDIHATPAEILARPDAALCLASGVTVAMGSTPIGFISGPRLAGLLAAAFAMLEQETMAGRTETKRMQRQSRMFAAGLSHELRTPVSAISGYSELIALGLESGRTVSAANQNAIIWEAAQSLLGTIDLLLDVAALEAGAARLAESEFSVTDLAEAVVRMLATLANERGVVLKVQSAAELPTLFADRRMIRQILVNLATNAIKYGSAGGAVTIAARVDRRECMIVEVRDTGPGMSANAIQRAMLPFQRGEASQKLPGSGLGLPLVKAFAELHEGRFQIVSTPGKGTRALVTMPPGRVRSPRHGRQEAFAFQRTSPVFG